MRYSAGSKGEGSVRGITSAHRKGVSVSWEVRRVYWRTGHGQGEKNMARSSRICQLLLSGTTFLRGQASILRMPTKALLAATKSRSQIRHDATWNRHTIVDCRNEGCSLEKIEDYKKAVAPRCRGRYKNSAALARSRSRSLWRPAYSWSKHCDGVQSLGGGETGRHTHMDRNRLVCSVLHKRLWKERQEWKILAMPLRTNKSRSRHPLEFQGKQ